MYLCPSSASFHHSNFQNSSIFLSLCLVLQFEFETMKQSFNSGAIVLCIFFIISSSALSARLLANKEGKEEVKLNEITDIGGSLVELEGTELMNLMGVEDCVDGDEDCSNRRIIAEAHLDYIYTQHHKP